MITVEDDFGNKLEFTRKRYVRARKRRNALIRRRWYMEGYPLCNVARGVLGWQRSHPYYSRMKKGKLPK